MTYPMNDVYAAAPITDPLAGLPRPEGRPEAMRRAGHAFEGAGEEIENTSHRLKRSVGEVVGGVWLGKAGSSCEQAVTHVAEAYSNVAGYNKQAGHSLGACANWWEAALVKYDHARQLANQAMEDEADNRRRMEDKAQQLQSSGDLNQASSLRLEAASWQSPQRDRARRQAQEAIQDFDQATQRTRGELDSIDAGVKTALKAAALGAGLLIGTGSRLGDAKFVDRPKVAKSLGGSRYGGKLADATGWSKWLKGTKWLGPVGDMVGIGIAGHSQWRTDMRKHPEMETDERVGRAVAQAGTVGLGGAVAGAAAGAAIGSVVPVAGTAAGAVVGAAIGAVAATGVGEVAGDWIDKHNDAAVEWTGNQFDKIDDAWDNVTPW